MPDRQIFGSSRIPGPLGLGARTAALPGPGEGGRPAARATRPVATPSPSVLPHPRPVVAEGVEPTTDGEVNTYNVSEYAIFCVPETYQGAFLLSAPPVREKRHRAKRTGSYKVVFVNGQSGNPKKHMMQACALAAVSGGPVQGIYNASRGLPADTLKSLWLKLTSAGLMNVQSKIVGFFEGQKASEAAIRKHLRSRDCPASAALFELLLKDEYHDARIVGHSQGNIVVCNAINGILACRGKPAIEKMRVIAVASPTVFWEEGVHFQVYNLRNDMVGWLSGDLRGTLPAGVMGWSATDDGGAVPSEVVTGYKATYWNVLTHSFYLYLGKLWELLQPSFP